MERNNNRAVERFQEAQIVRKDAKNAIFEVMDTGFRIGKVLMNFQQYDKNAPAGSKVQKKISIYMDFPAFLRLVNDFTNTGNGPKKIFAEKKAVEASGKRYYGTQIAMGGTSVAGLQKQNRQRPDGKDEFRSLAIAPSTMANSYALFVSSGPGKQSSTGGFMMDGVPDQNITFPITTSDWAEVLLITKASIEAYLSYVYAKRFSVLDRERAEYFASQNNAPYQQNNRYNNPPQQSRPQTVNNQPNYQQAPDTYADTLDVGSIGASSSDFSSSNYGEAIRF